MLRLNPTTLMPGSYPSPAVRTQTPPTPAETPVSTSPMSHPAHPIPQSHLPDTPSSPSMPQTSSSDEDQRPRSQSPQRVPARMSIRRRSRTSSTEALHGYAQQETGVVSPSGSSFSLYRAPSRTSIRKGGYTIDAEEVDGEAQASDVVSPSGSSVSLYRVPSRTSVRKRDYSVDAKEMEGEASGSGSPQSPNRAPSHMSIRKRDYAIETKALGGEASGSRLSRSPHRVLTRMPIRKRSYKDGTKDLEAEAQQSPDILSGSGASFSCPPTRMQIRKRSYTMDSETLGVETWQSSDVLSGSRSTQPTDGRAEFYPPSRRPTPFMLNAFISMANHHARTSLDGDGQQWLNSIPGRDSKDPSGSQQPHQPSRSHQGSNGMSYEDQNLGHQIFAAATKAPQNANITNWTGPVNRIPTPFPHGAKYNTSPARLQRVSAPQDPIPAAPTPRSLPYHYDISQDPFRDSFSNHPLTVEPQAGTLSAYPPSSPPERHDSPSSITHTFHPGFTFPLLTDPHPYPHIRSSPLYKGPPELKHLAPNPATPPPPNPPPLQYYDPITNSFHPVPKADSPPPTTRPLFPRRPTVRSPLHQRIWLGSPESFDRLPEYTGDTPSPEPRERGRRVRVVSPGSEGGEVEEEEGEEEYRVEVDEVDLEEGGEEGRNGNECERGEVVEVRGGWSERVKGWFKSRGRDGRRWRERWVRRGEDENGEGDEDGVEIEDSVETGDGDENVDGVETGGGGRKRLVERVRRKVGGVKLKERVKRMFKRREKDSNGV